MIFVQDLMHAPVISVGESDELDRVEELFREKGIRHLPVTRGHRLVGLISHRDYLVACQRARHQSEPIWASEFMNHDVVTVTPDTPAHEAAKRMLDRKIGCLPVVSSAGTLVGIVTETDFVHYARQLLEREWKGEATAELGP